MIATLADTHAVIWYLAAEPTLSAKAHAFIEDVVARGDQVGVSTMTLIESTYLVEKGRLPSQSLQQIVNVLAQNDGVFREVVVDGAVARALRHVSREQVPDLPDRIIAATAVLLNVPLITRDRRIAAFGLHTIW